MCATCLGLFSCDRAAHDEPVTPHSPVPLGPYTLDLDILKSGLGKPLQYVKTVRDNFLYVDNCAGNSFEGMALPMPFRCYMKVWMQAVAGLDVNVHFD